MLALRGERRTQAAPPLGVARVRGRGLLGVLRRGGELLEAVPRGRAVRVVDVHVLAAGRRLKGLAVQPHRIGKLALLQRGVALRLQLLRGGLIVRGCGRGWRR